MELPAFYFFGFQVDKNGNMYYCINQIIQIDINIYRAGADRKTQERKMDMAWNLDSDRPIYAQILERIQRQIVSGEYAPGTKIPSVRELAAQAGVNPNTMQKALSELERSGLVVTMRTSGRVVTEDMEMIKQIRKQLAAEQAAEFVKQMKELGFQKADILALIEQETGGEEA